MDLRSYLWVVRKSWWIILLGIVVGTAGGFALNVTTVPQYQSSVTFFVSTSQAAGGTALQNDEFAVRRINSYAVLLTSQKVAQQIIDTTKIDLNASDLAGEIAATTDTNTVLLTATVTDTSARRSLVVATALANNFGKIVDQVDPAGKGTTAPVSLNVVSGPSLASAPVSPRKSLNLALGFVVGLALGLALAIARELLNNTVTGIEFLRDSLDLAPLGVVPFDSAARRSPLVLERDSRSPRSEALRRVRTNLRFLNVQSPASVIVVTSTIPSEGKSTTAINLSVVSAQSGSRTLLIDGDLRRPAVADYLGLEGEVGLTNLLAGQVELEDVLQPWGDVTVLCAGTIPPNPSELLDSQPMSDLIARLREDYQIIVIDTPPLLPVTDAAVAAAHADGALLVVRHGKAHRGQVTTAVGALRAVNARILGAVLNMVPARGPESSSYQTYGYGYGVEDPDARRWYQRGPFRRKTGLSGPAPSGPALAVEPAVLDSPGGVPARRTGTPAGPPDPKVTGAAVPDLKAILESGKSVDPAAVDDGAGAQRSSVTAADAGPAPDRRTDEANGRAEHAVEALVDSARRDGILVPARADQFEDPAAADI